MPSGIHLVPSPSPGCRGWLWNWIVAVLLVLFTAQAPGAGPPRISPEDKPIRLPLLEGKDIRFTHYSLEQGLPQSRVNQILQDNRGFMWFGTYNGLNRYDGYTFKVYKPEPNNPNSIGGVFITALFQDRSGVFWIGVDQGLDRFDPVTQKFTHFHSNPNDPASLAGHLEHMTQDRDGMLWLATRNGLDRLDPATGQFTHYRNDPANPRSLSSNDVRYVLEDKQGTLWVATATGLNAFDRRSGTVLRFYPGLRDRLLDRIFEDRSGTLWVSSTRGGGLAFLDRNTGRFTRYTWFEEGDLPPNVRSCAAIHEDRYGMLWLGANPDGVIKFDRTRRQFTRYKHDPGNPESLSSDNNVALSAVEDREGGIWVGTDGGGVNRFSSAPSPFTVYRKEPGNPNSLDQSFVLSVFEDSQGIVWIGTDQLNRLDRKTGRYTFFRHDPARSGSISDGSVYAIAEDPSGVLWLGTWGGGLNRFDRKTGRFKAYRHSSTVPDSLSNDNVLSLLVDHAGNLWAGTEDGVNRFDPRTQRFTAFRDARDPPPSRIYRVMTEGADGSIWMGTYEWGLQRLDVRTGRIVIFMNDPKTKGSLSSNRVNALHVDRLGQLWVGTQNGLDRFDPQTGSFVALGEGDGLPNNAVQGILEDEAGYLWVSTGNGLSKFDPRARTFKNYYAHDGLAGNEFHNFSVYFKSSDGEMFFGGPHGVTAFYPSKVVDNPYVPPIVLTDFRLFNNPVRVGEGAILRKSITSTDSLTLSHLQNIFSLEFSSLSFANPQRNRYRYMLEGLEKTWNEVGADQRFVTYTTLPPGRYTFRVQGSSGSGVWNEQGVSLAITVLPPWWKTWWFLLTSTVLLSGLTWTAYYLRVRSIRSRNRELTALNLDLEKSQKELRERESALSRLNRELRAISDCNEVLVRATDEQQLLHDICHIVCEKAGYRMAWVGYAEDDAARTVRAAVWAGADEGYLESTPIVWAEGPYGRGPTATSIRNAKTEVVQDLAGEFEQAPWRDKALQRGYRSCIALPLKNDRGMVFGAFTICSSEVNAFTTEEIRLLEELADDMAFGITVLRGRIERKRAEDEVRQLNAELEERVRQRTALLESANKELESFSYTVSHDLRAPLRHMSAFSRILLEEHGSQLPEEARELVNRIEQGTLRMGNLIDGLLKLTRMGRQEMRVEAVSLDQLVRELIEEMSPDWNSRQVEWKIAPLPVVRGEASLLRQVCQNLIANALKFSRDRSPAVIEIGEIPQDGMHLLFVRDNGVGFDMKYVDKLFGVFQRLHRVEEFEGTGIGLATVKRIIQKHGGQVWADARVGEGATFFFTLS